MQAQWSHPLRPSSGAFTADCWLSSLLNGLFQFLPVLVSWSCWWCGNVLFDVLAPLHFGDHVHRTKFVQLSLMMQTLNVDDEFYCIVVIQITRAYASWSRNINREIWAALGDASSTATQVPGPGLLLVLP